MATSKRDVVLLNSDTVVTERWIEKLQAAASSAAEIATVTPFSNNATICSIPRFLAVNAIPSGHDVESFARLVERCAAREYPRIPTGVGVCLYVKRRVLDAVGAFDEGTFGLGYGEETTSACGRRSRIRALLDDATSSITRASAASARAAPWLVRPSAVELSAYPPHRQFIAMTRSPGGERIHCAAPRERTSLPRLRDERARCARLAPTGGSPSSGGPPSAAVPRLFPRARPPSCATRDVVFYARARTRGAWARPPLVAT